MSEHYLLTKKVLILTLRVPKSDAGYFLHLLEACDNLGFASTLDAPMGVTYRDIHLMTPIEWSVEIKRWLQQIHGEIPWELLHEEIKIDTL